MSPLEFEIGQSVVERLRVQVHHIVIATFVLRVAVLAVVRLILIQTSVITLPFRYVGFDIGMIVAEQAASRLARLLQGLMAALTLLLELGMPLDDGTGHQHQIEFSGYGQHRDHQQTAD
jgi:hypothetical protein